MDKLKPILAQKFWIFFVLVLILPVVGYSMTKGKLADQIKTRWDKLEGTIKDIPTGADSPNEQWIKGLNDLNEKLKLDNTRAVLVLWDKQFANMRWPKDIAPVMSKTEYFKSPARPDDASKVQFMYPHDYPTELQTMWEIVEPYDDGMNVRDTSKRRKVILAMADLHQASGGAWSQKWDAFPPTLDEIWAAQEDIWLQTELLNAVARVNSGATSQLDAFVKHIGKIMLFGGTRVAGGGGDAAAPAGPEGPGDGLVGGEAERGMGVGFGFGGGSFGGMGGYGRAAGSMSLAADIPLAEEFNVLQEGAGGTGYGGLGGVANEGEASPAGAVGQTSSTNSTRYIGDDENRPFRQRGFYFKVIMDHRRVPELLAELMSSPYPVEIVRMHQVWHTDGGVPSSSGAGIGGMFGAGAGGGIPGYGAPPGGAAGGAGLPGGIAGFGKDFGQPRGGFEDTAGVRTPRYSTGFPPGGTATPGEGAAGTGTPGTAAMSDPNLASVAILGVWTLYRKPAVDANQAAPTAAPRTSPATPNDVATAAPAVPAAASDTSASEPDAKVPTGDSTEKPAEATDPDTAPTAPRAPAKAGGDSKSEKPAESVPQNDAADPNSAPPKKNE